MKGISLLLITPHLPPAPPKPFCIKPLIIRRHSMMKTILEVLAANNKNHQKE